MVSIDKLSVRFGGFELLREISFLINQNDRIGLTGKNGAGKSTLLKIIAGIDKPSDGSVSLPRDITIGYLPQQMNTLNIRTVWEEALLAYENVLDLNREINRLHEEITHRKDYINPDYLKLADHLTDLNEHYRILGGDNYEAEIEQALTGLGFERTDFNRPTSEFSGGWRMRIELAKILLKKPSLFLLDEPTNHLDIESIQWFEEYLKNYRGATILVSHDKAFLDNVTTRTIELTLGRIYDLKANYTGFVAWKRDHLEQQVAAFRNQQKMIDDTEKFIERFRYKPTKAVQVQSRIKQLEKLDRIEVDEEDFSGLRIKFPPSPRSGNVVVEGRNISKSYGSLSVLDAVDLTITRGERVAFVGRNGEGKTTFARIITDEIDYTGNLKIGHNVKIGYFAQDQAERLDPEKTVFETIDEIATGDIRPKIRSILGSFLFSGEEADKKVKVLSGGEKSRLAMIRLLLDPVNFLVLDEPTNHLDMNSKEILKQALSDYDGTILLVSHDREFLEGLVGCVYEFRNRKIKQHLGGIYEFLEKKKINSLKELEFRRKPPAGDEKGRQAEGVVGDLSFEEKKNINRNIAKFEKSVELIETRIHEIEAEITRLDQLLSAPEDQDIKNLVEKYGNAKSNLETAMGEWENLHLELENWQKQKKW